MTSIPERVRFSDRLAVALSQAIALGTIDPREYEALLVDPEFDDDEFERFRAEAERHGLALPEDGEAAETATVETRAIAGDGERDLLDLYLDEIGRIPLLEHRDLLVLAARARAGDPDARRRVILANLRLVVHVARGYRNRGLPMLDLIEEGNLGLIHAVDRFEPERGLRFSTYASIWIRQSILRGLAEQSRAVRIPVQMFQQMNRWVRLERVLRARLGREPLLREVADEMRISPQRAERLAGLIRGMRALDEGPDLEDLEQLGADAFEGLAPPSVERLVELQLEHEKIDRLLRSLGQREEQVLRIRYGFYDGVARTLQQTGEHFGITRERVRQIESRALEKLRQAIDLQDLDRDGGTGSGTTIH